MIRGDELLRAVGLTVFLFSLLVCAYVVIIQITHADWMDYQFSHIQYFPFNWQLGEVGIAVFAVAAGGFLIWQIELNNKAK